jgi:hypothetical protein
MTLVFVLASVASPAGFAGAATTYGGGLGVGYQAPRDHDLTDLYGTGPTFHAMGEAEFDGVPMSLALEVGYSRMSSDNLAGSFLVDSVEGRLERIPIDLVARFPFTDGERHPYVGAGFELLWTKESFTYRLDGETGERDPSGQYSPGGILVVGLERSTAPRFRLEGYLSYVPVQRQVSREERYDPGNAGRVDEGSLGARLTWRFP